MELDAKVIVEMLNNADSSNKKFSSLLLDCRSLIASLTQDRVTHVYREVNRCVDFLAKKGCCMREDFVIFDVYPSNDLDKLLVSDINGLYCYRRGSHYFDLCGQFVAFFCCLISCLLTKKNKIIIIKVSDSHQNGAVLG